MGWGGVKSNANEIERMHKRYKSLSGKNNIENTETILQSIEVGGRKSMDKHGCGKPNIEVSEVKEGWKGWV